MLALPAYYSGGSLSGSILIAETAPWRMTEFDIGAEVRPISRIPMDLL